MSTHRGDQRTMARHEALRSPLAPDQLRAPLDVAWLRARAELFARVSGVEFRLVLDLKRYEEVSGLVFHPHYVAQVYRGEESRRLAVPLMAVNLRLVPHREAADKAFAHETMHLKWPSYGHKEIAFVRAQQLLDAVGLAA